MNKLSNFSNNIEPAFKQLQEQFFKQRAELESQNKIFINLKREGKKLQKQYQELYDFSPSSFLTLDENQIIHAINFQTAKILGGERETFIGNAFLDYIGGNSRAKWLSHFNLLNSGQSGQACELELIKKEGRKIPAQVQAQVLSNGLIHLTIDDLSKFNDLQAESIEVKKSLTLFHNLFQRTSDALAGLNENLVFLIYNDSFIELFSKIYPAKINVGMNLNNILADSELDFKIKEACKTALSGKTAILLLENQSIKHENYYYYELSIDSIFNSFYQRHEFIFHIRDLSKHKVQESILREQQAEVAYMDIVKTKSEVLSVITHEVNQPLTAINAFCQGMIYKLKNSLSQQDEIKPFASNLEKILAQANHIEQILHRMRERTKGHKNKVQELDLNLLIKETLLFLYYEPSEFNLKIELNFTKDLPVIKLDKTAMMQIILNLPMQLTDLPTTYSV